MVLITSLATPFFASLICIALALVRPATDFMMPEPVAGPLGEFAVDVFAWAALPSTVGAIALSPFVLQHGTYSWLHAAVAGVLAFMAAAIIFPLPIEGALPFLAFLSGLISIGIRAMLIRGGILLPAPKG
jgi:hypothetical protein